MSNGSVRSRVLSVYHNILRLAQNWEAIDPAKTVVERDYIRREASTKFRENKEMSTLSESSSNNECQSRASSPTLPSSNGSDGEKISDGTLEDLAMMSKLSEDVKRFIRAYFACSPTVIADEHFFSFVYAYDSADGGEQIAKLIFGSRFSEVYLPKYEFECKLIRRINAQNDARGLFSDFLFDKFTKLFDWPITFEERHFHRIFIDPSFTDYIAIRENVYQISGGTTGLSSWQAACVMAEFLRSGVLKDFLANKTERFASATTVPIKKLNLLELGAGCGLSGISVAKFLSEVVGSLTLTDHADRVLQRLRSNVELNFGGSEALCDKIRVKKLDWLDYDLDELCFVPDVIFASDVIFDPEIIGPFCALLRNLFTFKPGQKQSNCWKNDESSDLPPPTSNSKESLADEDSSSPLRLAYVAATVRNPDTIDCFRKELVLKGLYIQREFLHKPYQKYFETTGKEQLYHFTPIFPSISISRPLLNLPTLIFEIGAECFR